MPEPVDFGRECDHTVEKCRDVLGMSGEQISEVRFSSKLFVQSERLRQALSDLALRAADNRRWLAFHGGEPNRSDGEGQGSLSGEPASQLREDRQIGMESDSIKPPDAEREE
jgi:hypothetical protein